LCFKTNMVRNIFSLKITGHHILFFVVLLCTGYLSFNPGLLNKIKGFFNTKRTYLCFLFIFTLVSLEFMLRGLFPGRYPAFTEVRENRSIRTVNSLQGGDPSVYRKNDYYPFLLKPNLNAIVNEKRFSISFRFATNEDGFRFEKTNGNTKKIMILGDSVTFGWGVSDADCYPNILQRLVGKDFKVLNFGVPAWGPAEYYLLYRKYQRILRPDLIILGLFIGNDLADLYSSHWKENSENSLPESDVYRSDLFVDKNGVLRERKIRYRIPVIRNSSVWVCFCEVALQPIIDHIDHVLRELKGNKPAKEEVLLKIIEDIAAKHELLILMLPAEYNYGGSDQIVLDDLMGKLSQIRNVYIINFYEAFRSKIKKIYLDGSHLTQYGNEMVADSIYRWLSEKGFLSHLDKPDALTIRGKNWPIVFSGP
ncbi:SGNH/GDSL hydrolase family protein, partial [Thermodesulfobacteriota bacterium]